MLELVTNINHIANYVRLMRINLLNANNIEILARNIDECEKYTINTLNNKHIFSFAFYGSIYNDEAKVNGFSGEIIFKMPKKGITLKSIGINTTCPQIFNNDLHFDDHAFFAIESATGKIKLFHNCNFKPIIDDYEDYNENIDFISWNTIKLRFIEIYKPNFKTALSKHGIIRSGVELFDLSSNKFSNIIYDFKKHLISEA